jgi:energy-converting hydrogenase Eha subunit A
MRPLTRRILIAVTALVAVVSFSSVVLSLIAPLKVIEVDDTHIHASYTAGSIAFPALGLGVSVVSVFLLVVLWFSKGRLR